MAFQTDAFQQNAFQPGPADRPSAFQGNAFQGNAFQVGHVAGTPTPPSLGVPVRIWDEWYRNKI